MTKALIFSDLHVHNHKGSVDRLGDCISVLHWIFDIAEEKQCEYLFFLGDMFHERSKIDVRNYLETFQTIRTRLQANSHIKEMEILLGNHDMYYKERWDVSSIRPLSAIDRVNVIDTPTRLEIANLKIDWMPYTDNPIRDLTEHRKEYGPGDLLMGHMSVDGAMLNMCYGTQADIIVEHDNEMVKVSPEIFKDWKMTFLGHYHGAQNLNDRVEYIGSPLQLSFGEAFQKKHICILDLNTLKKEYIENTFSPKHLILTQKDLDAGTYDLNGNFVRLELASDSQQVVVDIKKDLQANNELRSFDTVRKPRDKKQDQKDIEQVQIVTSNIEDVLKQYIDQTNVPEGLDKEHLLKIGRSCLITELESNG